MKPLVGIACAVAVVLGTIPLTSMAQHRDRDHDRGREWRGDIRHFEYHDARRWQSGAWRHGSHEGRLGWWWVIGGLWYFYPQPVYPYPDPYRPPVVVVEQSPPPVVVQPPAASPAPTQYWYYCEAAKGYYPYVASCPRGWKTVPATPPGVPQ